MEDFAYARFRLIVHWSFRVMGLFFLAIPLVFAVAGVGAFVYAVFFSSQLVVAFVLGGGILGLSAWLGWRWRSLFQAFGDPEFTRVEFRETSLVIICPFALTQDWPPKMEFEYAALSGVSEPTTESHFWGWFYPLPAKAGHIDVSLIRPLDMTDLVGSGGIRVRRRRSIAALHLHLADPDGFRSELVPRLILTSSAETLRR